VGARQRRCPVLRNAIGARMRTDAIRSRLRAIATAAGVIRVITPHNLRSTVVTLSLGVGVPEAGLVPQTQRVIDCQAGYRLAAWLDSD
jgi:integrase